MLTYWKEECNPYHITKEILPGVHAPWGHGYKKGTGTEDG